MRRRTKIYPYRCHECGKSRSESTRQCKNCHTEFWCPWNPDWYKGRLTRVSIGKDKLGRQIGILFAVVGTLVLLYGAFLQVQYASAESEDTGALFGVLIGAFATYEVWAYFHGRQTSIDSFSHEPRPDKTLWRTVGLVGDFAYFGIACAILYDSM